MRRTDRLYALVEELRAQAPRSVSRAVLSERFEVSARTVERDILALQQSGVPIWTQRGRNGGYAIEPKWTLPPLNFDATEALAVIAALTAAHTMPFAEAGRRAEQKILAAMRADEADKARQVAGRLRLRRSDSSAQRSVIAATENAVVERRVVVISYEDRAGEATRREVEAHGLHMGPRSSYLLGWCRMRDEGRAFRLDRIVDITVTDEIAPEREIDSLADWMDDTMIPEAAGAAEEEPAVPRERRAHHGGPPRRGDDGTGSSSAFARAIALSLPGVEEHPHFDRPSFRVDRKIFLVLKPDDTAFVKSTPEDEAALMAARPEAFVSDNGLQVKLRALGRDDVRELIEDAWRLVAPKRAITAYDAARRRRPAPVSLDDVRRLLRALPEVEEREMPASGQTRFMIKGRRNSLFAKYGPGIGNLLPPDDEDTLMIRYCEERPVLLAKCPERYFITVHYGDPSEPGPVLTRLCENTVDDLDELRELLAESWRYAAPKRLAQQWDRSNGNRG